MNKSPRCYSLRQLSPFAGTVQVISNSYCRALSVDGNNWQIQASCETHQQEWNISPQEYIPRRYVLYGNWSHDKGFSSLPLDPMLDVPSLEHVESSLIQHMNALHSRTPFDAIDHYECWALHKESLQPLALLGSVSETAMIPHARLSRWQAVPEQDRHRLKPHQQMSFDRLQDYINSNSLEHAWFQRDAQHIGLPLQPDQKSQPLPRLPLNRDMFADCTEDFHNWVSWLSPRLLTLQTLDDELFQQLALLAQNHAIETARRLNVYPRRLPEKILNTIQVELKIRGL